MKCPNCNREIPDEAKFCLHCGGKIVGDSTIECPNCHHQIPEDSKFCPDCGGKIEVPSQDIISALCTVENVKLGETNLFSCVGLSGYESEYKPMQSRFGAKGFTVASSNDVVYCAKDIDGLIFGYITSFDIVQSKLNIVISDWLSSSMIVLQEWGFHIDVMDKDSSYSYRGYLAYKEMDNYFFTIVAYSMEMSKGRSLGPKIEVYLLDEIMRGKCQNYFFPHKKNLY